MEEKKLYPVFALDMCFDSWAMDEALVGAEDEDDLIKHLKLIIQYKKEINKISKERETRIAKVPNLYTDKPYEILERYAYYE